VDRSIGEPLEARVCCPAMSRAFVKDADEVEELPDRPISDHPNEVTREGLQQIEAALSAAQETYAAAQATGDREGLSGAGRDLRYWTARRSSAVVAPEPHDNSVVRFGHTVTIVRDDGREQTFRIVDEDEADPARGTISQVSPLARTLFGRGIGDVVSVAGGDGEIMSIR
jgi:transcription elongation GreA/GreB family factor